MKVSLPKLTFLLTFSVFLFLTAHVTAPKALAGRTCCVTGTSGCGSCDTSGKYWKTNDNNSGTSPCGAGENCGECGVDGYSSDQKVGNECGSTGTGTGGATCTQYVYALENPTNMTVGQVKDFYADGHANTGNFAKMVASVTNVPLGGLAVATVATTSGPTCYSTNGNCRQGFRLTARNNGTALVKVTTQVKLCPACAISGNCSQTYTLNVGAVTPLACKPGAKCVSSTGAFTAGAAITCSMPVLTTTELNGGRAGYFVRCTPYKGTVAQTVVAKSSITGTFAPFTQATGVTNIKCSFRHCVTGTDSVTKCTDWGAAS